MTTYLTTYSPNADGLKASENAYILVGFIFSLVENSPRKCSQQTVVMPWKFKNILNLAAHVNTHICSFQFPVLVFQALEIPAFSIPGFRDSPF
jgi:hypothetical protein